MVAFRTQGLGFGIQCRLVRDELDRVQIYMVSVGSELVLGKGEIPVVWAEA